MRRLAALVALPLALALLAGCGKKGNGGLESGPTPVLGVHGTQKHAAPSLGFPGFATKNTTRVGGADPVADAAGVALAVYPGGTKANRPPAVAMADARDWRSATAAAALMGAPVRAPLLLSAGTDLPGATKTALDELKPTGSDPAGGGQVIAVGKTPTLPGRKVTRISPRKPGPFELAAAVDRFLAAAKGKPASNVIVVSADQAAFGVPAAAYAAKTGTPVLFVQKDSVPAATQQALLTHARPHIYVLGPTSSVGPKAVTALGKLGTVVRIGASDPVRNAIAFARYIDGQFGWGVIDPGHALVFANARRPLDGPASAALGASGMYGPLLLTTNPAKLPSAVRGYLLDIQPGYRKDPVRGVYNHGWFMGDNSVFAPSVQAQVDGLLEIAPVKTVQ